MQKSRRMALMAFVSILVLIVVFLVAYFIGRHIAKHQGNDCLIIPPEAKDESREQADFMAWRKKKKCRSVSSCKRDDWPHKSRTVILISLDGFKPSYLHRSITPAINRLIECGIGTKYMENVYPTKTFPNHYTLSTGLYPESHGIVANRFYDPSTKQEFRLGDKNTSWSMWWGGEPMWVTMVKQNRTSAAYFFPGSDSRIDGYRPNYYRKYKRSTPFESRVETVLQWLDLPVDSRPEFISLYFNQPDSNGHSFGVYAKEVNEAVARVDGLIDRLMHGLFDRYLLGCVNVILTSDHGMSNVKETIDIKNSIDVQTRDIIFYDGAFARFRFVDESTAKEKITNVKKSLTCSHPNLRIYERGELPIRFHYSNNERIDQILLDIDPEYVALTLKHSFFPVSKGAHGYDPIHTSMWGLFAAHGPAFKSGITVEPFSNLEIYNAMSTILEVNPAPNNGTQGSLYHLLSNPPKYPVRTTENDAVKSTCTDYSASERACECQVNDCSESECQQQILNESQTTESQRLHLAHGDIKRQKVSSGRIIDEDTTSCNLIYKDFVLGYHKQLNLPLWASFNVDPKTFQITAPNKDRTCLIRDTRIPNRDNGSTCKVKDATPGRLFTGGKESWMITNTLPMYPVIKESLKMFDDRLKQWSIRFGNLNVIRGPLFDYNRDGLSYSVSDIVKRTKINDSSIIPSHIFNIVSWCNDRNKIASKGNECRRQEDVTNLAVVLPNRKIIDNCQIFSDWIWRNSARVKDIEIATGLEFYTDLEAKERIRLQTKIPNKDTFLEFLQSE